MQEAPKSSLKQRLIALVVLMIAGWILLKVVIGLLAGLATIIVIVAAIAAIFWAVNTL